MILNVPLHSCLEGAVTRHNRYNVLLDRLNSSKTSLRDACFMTLYWKSDFFNLPTYRHNRHNRSSLSTFVSRSDSKKKDRCWFTFFLCIWIKKWSWSCWNLISWYIVVVVCCFNKNCFLPDSSFKEVKKFVLVFRLLLRRLSCVLLLHFISKKSSSQIDSKRQK